MLNMQVLTYNLRNLSDRWAERRPLVVDLIGATNADVIGFQEVSVPLRQLKQIFDRVHTATEARYQYYLAPKRGGVVYEAVGLAVRRPLVAHSVEMIALPGGARIAQRARVRVNGVEVVVANTHLHHKPYNSEDVRLPQMQALIDWLQPFDLPTILMGDLNAKPGSSTMAHALGYLNSAYAAMHGAEPLKTFPTPLRYHDLRDDMQSAIDYVLYTPGTLRPVSARIVGDASAPHDPTLYPSDHYGVLVDFAVG